MRSVVIANCRRPLSLACSCRVSHLSHLINIMIVIIICNILLVMALQVTLPGSR